MKEQKEALYEAKEKMNKYQDIINDIRCWIIVLSSDERKYYFNNELITLIDRNIDCGMKDFEELYKRVKNEVYDDKGRNKLNERT